MCLFYRVATPMCAALYYAARMPTQELVNEIHPCTNRSYSVRKYVRTYVLSACRHCLLQLTCRVGGSSCSVGTSLRDLLLLISPEVCEEGTAAIHTNAPQRNDWSRDIPAYLRVLPRQMASRPLVYSKLC